MSSSIWRSLSRLGGTRNATTAWRRHSLRWASSVPSSSGNHHPYDVDELPGAPSAKVLRIVDDIASLTLAEVADMSMLLKKRLRIPNVPVMPMGMNVVPDMWYETSIAAHRMFPPGHDLDRHGFVDQQQQQQQRRKASSPPPPPPQPASQQKQSAGGKTAAKKSPAKGKAKVSVTETETETEVAMATATTTTTSEEDEVVEDDEEGVTVEEVLTEEEAVAAEIDGEDLDEDVKPKKPKNRPELRFCKRNGALPVLKDTVQKKKPIKSDPSGPSISWDPPEPVLAAVASAAPVATGSSTVEPTAAPSAAASSKKKPAGASSKSKKSSKK